MRINQNPFIRIIFICFISLIGSTIGYTQEDDSKEKIAEYQAEVGQMVSFLEFSLNILGDPDVSAKDKDVIINESYLKIFKDDKVQIEDDLDEHRDVVTNKDVQAYLKDVDFFFKRVKFGFNVIDIANDVNQEGNIFFTVKMMRNLSGITVENDSINSDKERYIEVNVDEENKDLRIVSIYTTKLSRKEELTIWWSGLSKEWKTLLGVDIEIKEGLRLSEIQEFSDSTYVVDNQQITDSIKIIDFVKLAAAKEEINLRGSKVITELKPLDQLKKLKKLDISSSDIVDLFPIRNLTTIDYLDCSNTMVDDLQPLKYSKSLRSLFISNTPVSSITVIKNFENLEILHMEHTVIDSLPTVDKLVHLIDLNCASTNLVTLDSVKYLSSLVNLNISNTIIKDLEPISGLTHLKKLNLNHTLVTSISALSSIKSLEEVSFDNSEIDDLMSLKELKNLKTVYADNSKIDMMDFIEFSNANQNVNIIFISNELFAFWETLSPEWKQILGSVLQFGDSIGKNDIHTLLELKELDIHGHQEITNLLPLKYIPLLVTLDISDTQISDLKPAENLKNLNILKGVQSKVRDLSPTKGLTALTVINFENTEVSDISPLANCKQLDSLFFNNSKVKKLTALNSLPNFKIAYFDNSEVTDGDVYNLAFDEKKSIVVYKTEKLRVWWGNMDDNWQDIFRNLETLSSRPNTEELHKLTSNKTLNVTGTSLKDLNPIPEFVRLEFLTFTDTRIASLYPLVGLKNLKSLKCPSNPIDDIEALSSLSGLQVLDMDNTQVDDLKPIASLVELRELKFSGTNVKDIDPIETLVDLEVLEFSKTRVKQINALESLHKLNVLKCNNNKISTKKIEEFKLNNPDCEVVFY